VAVPRSRVGWDLHSTGPQPAKLVEFKETAKFNQRWHESFGDSGENPLQPALTADAVYGVSGKGTLTRLDRATGRQVWRVESKMPVSAGVGSGEGLVLIGSDKGEVQAFGEDGKLRWKHIVSSEVLRSPASGRRHGDRAQRRRTHYRAERGRVESSCGCMNAARRRWLCAVMPV